MKATVKHGRGIGIEIDGQVPANSWSVGETEFGFIFHGTIGSERGVMVGPHEVKGIEYDCRVEDICEGTDPVQMVLKLASGDIPLRVTGIREDEPVFWVDAESFD